MEEDCYNNAGRISSSDRRTYLDEDNYDDCGGCDADISDFGDLDTNLNFCEKPAVVSYIDGPIFRREVGSSNANEDLEELEAVVGELEETIKQIYDNGHRNPDKSLSGYPNVAVSNGSNMGEDKSEDPDYDSVHESSEYLEEHENSTIPNTVVERRNTVSFDMSRKTDPENAQAVKSSRRSLRFSKVVVPSFVSQLPNSVNKSKTTVEDRTKSSLNTIRTDGIFNERKEESESKSKPDANSSSSKKNGLARLKNTFKKPSSSSSSSTLKKSTAPDGKSTQLQGSKKSTAKTADVSKTQKKIPSMTSNSVSAKAPSAKYHKNTNGSPKCVDESGASAASSRVE